MEILIKDMVICDFQILSTQYTSPYFSLMSNLTKKFTIHSSCRNSIVFVICSFTSLFIVSHHFVKFEIIYVLSLTKTNNCLYPLEEGGDHPQVHTRLGPLQSLPNVRVFFPLNVAEDLVGCWRETFGFSFKQLSLVVVCASMRSLGLSIKSLRSQLVICRTV